MIPLAFFASVFISTVRQAGVCGGGRVWRVWRGEGGDGGGVERGGRGEGREGTVVQGGGDVNVVGVISIYNNQNALCSMRSACVCHSEYWHADLCGGDDGGQPPR